MSNEIFVRYLTVREERLLFRAIAKCAGQLAVRDLNWMQLMRRTGLRVTPTSRLTVGDAVDALSTGELTVGEHNKRKKRHVCYLTKGTRRNLQALLRTRKALGYSNADHDAPLIMSRNHKGLSVRSFQARMRLWVKRAGLEVVATPHWFRHTLGKRIMQESTAKDPRRIAQLVLGHTRMETTLIYTQPDREDIQRTMFEVAA